MKFLRHQLGNPTRKVWLLVSLVPYFLHRRICASKICNIGQLVDAMVWSFIEMFNIYAPIALPSVGIVLYFNILRPARRKIRIA